MHNAESQNYVLPSTESLIIPTETRAAFPFTMKSCVSSCLSAEHPGGTTGKDSCPEKKEKSTLFRLPNVYFHPLKTAL